VHVDGDGRVGRPFPDHIVHSQRVKVAAQLGQRDRFADSRNRVVRSNVCRLKLAA
jgi:hypothetical protein